MGTRPSHPRTPETLDDGRSGGTAERLTPASPKGRAGRGRDGWHPETIRAVGREIRNRRTTSLDITNRCLELIERDHKRLNAFVHVMGDEARAASALADQEIEHGVDRGPLHGVPLSLKDSIDVANVRTSAGSRATEGQIAVRDAAVVRRLREHGAVLVGKTNLHEFAYGTTNEDSAFGAARNPWDPRRSPGGSSGGSAISIASGMAFGSIGTDSGGSVRIPAAACGVVGLKPSLGELPTDGVIPLSTTLDHVGVMAATVHDVFLLYNALKGTGRGRLVEASLVRLRFGVLHSYFCDALDPEVSDHFEGALMRFSRGNSILLDRLVPHADLIAPTFSNLLAPEAFAYHAATLHKSPNVYTRAVKDRIKLGESILASEYVEARQAREQLTQAVDALFTDVDVLMLPTLPIPAPMLGAEQTTIEGEPYNVRSLMLKMTQLFNITGHPAISIPCGRTSEGLPCGLQLVAGRGRTMRLLEIALGCEAVLNGD